MSKKVDAGTRGCDVENKNIKAESIISKTGEVFTYL